MKSIKEELFDNSENIVRDCTCCSDDIISLDIVFKILKDRNIDIDKV